MDSYEATKMVFSRIQNLEPENASKVMGYLLLQDNVDKEMIRLAFGPETLLQNLIIQAKTHLGISSSNSPSNSSTLSPPSPNYFNPSISRANSSWPLLSLNNSTSSLSYASVVNGVTSTKNPTPTSHYNIVDEYPLHQDQFSFLNNDSVLDQGSGFFDETQLHRRSFSVPGTCFGSSPQEEELLGWKPCLYFAKGFCKNGNTCKFLHGDGISTTSADVINTTGGGSFVGSPSGLNELERCQELLLLRSNAATATSQFMTNEASSFPYNKCMNFLLQKHQNDSPRSAAAAALMLGDELHKFGRFRPERNDFSSMGMGGALSPGSSRQIYLTFPADSAFREEDVSNYFSIYGPVQDVRIPYQQKRMFGFVTFVYPETVKLILAKGNPHFVCDSRVLVKPYKEKGKVLEKKLQQQHFEQQMERAEYSSCLSPSGFSSKEPIDLHLGGRMMYNDHELYLRRKLEEQAELQQAIELHGRRLMNLQLADLKSHGNIRRHQPQYLHPLSPEYSVPSPTHSGIHRHQSMILLHEEITKEVHEENGGEPDGSYEKPFAETAQEGNEIGSYGVEKIDDGTDVKQENYGSNDSDLHESLEDVLPDNLFNSPKKSSGDPITPFSTAVEVKEDTTSPSITTSNNNPLMPSTSTLNVASFKSCLLQMPRLFSGHGTIGM